MPIGLPPKMRTISIVDRLTFDLKGNVTEGAVCLADIDNDGDMEFAIGTREGHLAIFKGTGSSPWRVSSLNLGQISAITTGDLFNFGFNVLVVISAEGYLYLFDLGVAPQSEKKKATKAQTSPSQQQETEEQQQSSPTSSSASASTPSTPAPECCSKDSSPKTATPERSFDLSEKPTVEKMKPIYVQRIPPNVKAVRIVDTNGDGFNELLVTLTDRVVRTYRWVHEGDIVSSNPKGFLSSVNKWEFGGQVGNVDLDWNEEEERMMLVSQPGGTFVRFPLPKGKQVPIRNDSEEQKAFKLITNYEHLVVSNLRNCNVETEILTRIQFEPQTGPESKDPLPMVLSTLDGHIICGKNDQPIWNLQVNHQLFRLSKMDVDSDGKEEVLISSWDGHTYIITHENRAYEFVFDENIATFCCGHYTLEDETVPVLVYVTCSGRVFVYYNISLPRDIEITTLPENFQLNEKVVMTPELTAFLLYAPINHQLSNVARSHE